MIGKLFLVLDGLIGQIFWLWGTNLCSICEFQGPHESWDLNRRDYISTHQRVGMLPASLKIYWSTDSCNMLVNFVHCMPSFLTHWPMTVTSKWCHTRPNRVHVWTMTYPTGLGLLEQGTAGYSTCRTESMVGDGTSLPSKVLTDDKRGWLLGEVLTIDFGW